MPAPPPLRRPLSTVSLSMAWSLLCLAPKCLAAEASSCTRRSAFQHRSTSARRCWQKQKFVKSRCHLPSLLWHALLKTKWWWRGRWWWWCLRSSRDSERMGWGQKPQHPDGWTITEVENGCCCTVALSPGIMCLKYFSHNLEFFSVWWLFLLFIDSSGESGLLLYDVRFSILNLSNLLFILVLL